MNGENNIMLNTLFSAYFRLIKLGFFARLCKKQDKPSTKPGGVVG